MAAKLPPRCASLMSALNRRHVLGTTSAVVAATALGMREAAAEVSLLDRAIADVTRGAGAERGRVQLVLPDLAENGNVVSLQVTVDSPMTATDHIRTITLLSEKNPLTTIGRFHLGPRAGRARVATNVRLAVTQRVVAIAETSDGRFFMGERSVVVTLAACINGG